MQELFSGIEVFSCRGDTKQGVPAGNIIRTGIKSILYKYKHID